MQQRPLIFAHRGLCVEAPENTLLAFQKAIDSHVDGVEFDVLLTSDGIPVVAHGNDLTPFTTTHTSIHSTSLQALRTINVATVCDEKLPFTCIPTLYEVLELLKPTNLILNIEIKTQPKWAIGIEKKVIDMIRLFGLERRSIISSFSPFILYRSKQLAPDIQRGILMAPRSFFFLTLCFFAKFLAVASINPIISHLTPKVAWSAKHYNWKILTWTVNTPEEAKKAIDHGVYGIITDNPATIREVITHG